MVLAKKDYVLVRQPFVHDFANATRFMTIMGFHSNLVQVEDKTRRYTWVDREQIVRRFSKEEAMLYMLENA